MDYGMGLNHTDKDTIAAMQIEIERLRNEVERLSEQNRALLDEQIPCACGYDSPDDVCGKHHPTFLRKIDAAHNAAIEAACRAILDGFKVWAAKPHNKKWVKRIDGTPIPNDVPVCIQTAIVALKRPVTEGDKP